MAQWILSLGLLGALCSFAQEGQAQTNGNEKKLTSVKGVVVNSVTGEPVTKATITLTQASGDHSTQEATVYSIAADSAGEFRLREIEPGTYRLSARRRGFIGPAPAGTRRDTEGLIIKLVSGDDLTQVKLVLTPQAVITGRILDADGEPLQGVQVHGLRLRWKDGIKVLDPVASTETNDLGEYRIRDLSAGRYHIAATVTHPDAVFAGSNHISKDAAALAYPPMFFPGVTDGSTALAVEVGPGAIRQGVDIRLAKMAGKRVSGRIVLPSGMKLPRTYVALLPGGIDEAMPSLQVPVVTTLNGGNTFEFRTVFPGRYVLRGDSEDSKHYLQAPLEVGDQDIEELQVPLRPLMRIVGRIRWEDGMPPGASTPVIRVARIRGGQFSESEGHNPFELTDLTPQRMRITVEGASAQDYVKAITYGNERVENELIDVIEGPDLEIVMRRGAASIEGSIDAGDDGPGANATVVLVPAAEAKRESLAMHHQTASDQNGHFEIHGIAPGEYVLFAFDSIEPGSWFDPEFLPQYEKRGERIKLEEKGHESKKLTLIRMGNR